MSPDLTREGATLVKWMAPADANSAGMVHGGEVMRACDEAAGIVAGRYSRRRVVTAAMDRMIFRHPVHVGQLLVLSASVNAVWNTSMEVGVRVCAEEIRTGEMRHTSTAYLTMVALDDDERPAPVPPLEVTTDEGRRREREAQLRRANRLAERDEIERQRSRRSG